MKKKIKITVPNRQQKAYLKNLIITHQMNISFRTKNGRKKNTHELGEEVIKWKLANDGKDDGEITFIE